MKKYAVYLSGGLALLSAAACKGIDPIHELGEYNDYVVCSYDNEQQTACAGDYARYRVKGDITTGYYTLTVEDIQLFDGDKLRSDTLSRLVQYFNDQNPDNPDDKTVRYTFFTQEASTRQQGDLKLNKLRFGWLSTQAWLTGEAFDGRYSLWSLPKSVRMYANETVVGGPGGEITENYLSPRYDMRFNTAASTVTFKATGVKYPVDIEDPGKTLSIASLTWADLPVKYTPTGFTISVDSFTPQITGKIGSTDIKEGDFKISNFDCTFGADYDSPRRVRFVMNQESTGLQLVVTTKLDYFIADNG